MDSETGSIVTCLHVMAKKTILIMKNEWKIGKICYIKESGLIYRFPELIVRKILEWLKYDVLFVTTL